MKARVKNTHNIVEVRPSVNKPKTWVTPENVEYHIDELEPVRVNSSTQIGTVVAVPIGIKIGSSGSID